MVVEDARENYSHIYPRWDIAFACVFDYTDSQEDSTIGLAREQLLGTLITIAPVIGTARVVSAAGHGIGCPLVSVECMEAA